MENVELLTRIEEQLKRLQLQPAQVDRQAEILNAISGLSSQLRDLKEEVKRSYSALDALCRKAVEIVEESNNRERLPLRRKEPKKPIHRRVKK